MDHTDPLFRARNHGRRATRAHTRATAYHVLRAGGGAVIAAIAAANVPRQKWTARSGSMQGQRSTHTQDDNGYGDAQGSETRGALSRDPAYVVRSHHQPV